MCHPDRCAFGGRRSVSRLCSAGGGPGIVVRGSRVGGPRGRRYAGLARRSVGIGGHAAVLPQPLGTCRFQDPRDGRWNQNSRGMDDGRKDKSIRLSRRILGGLHD